MMTSWVVLKVIVVEVWYIGSILKYLCQLVVEWNWLTYFGNAVFDVDIFYVQHVD